MVVTAEDVDNAKPHPEPVERALSLLDSEPRDTVFIGDSPHDLASGQAAGVSTAAVLWGPFDPDFLKSREPTHLLERPSEILTLRRASDFA